MTTPETDEALRLALDLAIKSGKDFHGLPLVQLRDALDALALAQRDAGRLDFAESKRATIYRSETGTHWVFVDETAKERRGELGGSLRGAIDIARAAMKESAK